jgi:predicted DNA-binding transcriptional regulator AlpA
MINDILPPVSTAEDRLLNIKQVAERMKVSPRHVSRLRARGGFPTAIRIGKCLRWLESDIVMYWERQREQKRD